MTDQYSPIEYTQTAYALPLCKETREGLSLYCYQEWKSVYGVKNRWADFDAMSDADLIKMADDLEREIVESINKERTHARKVLHAMANPDQYVVDIVGRDLNDSWDVEYMEAMERFGDYSHYEVYENPTPNVNAMAQAFAKIA